MSTTVKKLSARPVIEAVKEITKLLRVVYRRRYNHRQRMFIHYVGGSQFGFSCEWGGGIGNGVTFTWENVPQTMSLKELGELSDQVCETLKDRGFKVIYKSQGYFMVERVYVERKVNR